MSSRFTALVMGTLALLTFVGCAPAEEGADFGGDLLAIDVSNRRPIAEVASPARAGEYAKGNAYYGYAANMLKPGMKVLFSASYGAAGGEAGQSRGVLVEGENGDLFYKQESNTTTQLLLAPGLPFRSSGGASGTSLWNLTEYVNLVNQVAFGEASKAGSPTEVYAQTSAWKVDFKGGTAGRQVSYADAMELSLEKKNPDSVSNVSLYFAQNIGAVAMEFRETGAPGGTFKIYIGESLQGQNVAHMNLIGRP
jgi:hypothetical protein